VTKPDACSQSDLESVRQSFQRCQKHDEFSDIFYDHLALQSSEIGPMFAQTDMVKQNELLQTGIQDLIDFAAGKPEIEQEIHRLAVLHDRAHHNTRPDLYPLWIHALVQTVLETDNQATTQTTDAWKRVVTPGIELMISLY